MAPYPSWPRPFLRLHSGSALGRPVPPFPGHSAAPLGNALQVWRSGGTSASAWSTLAGSREEAGWREMRFVNFAGTEGKLARNSSVYFKPSTPSYPSENAGQNSPWSGRSLKNYPLRPGAASGGRTGRTGRNCRARRRPDFEVNTAISCQLLHPFPAPSLSRPAGDRHNAGMS